AVSTTTKSSTRSTEPSNVLSVVNALLPVLRKNLSLSTSPTVISPTTPLSSSILCALCSTMTSVRILLTLTGGLLQRISPPFLRHSTALTCTGRLVSRRAISGQKP